MQHEWINEWLVKVKGYVYYTHTHRHTQKAVIIYWPLLNTF